MVYRGSAPQIEEETTEECQQISVSWQANLSSSSKTIRYQRRNSSLLQRIVRAESVECMHIIILQMLICTQVYADANAHTDTCTRSTNTVSPTTNMDTQAINQTDIVHSCLVSKGRECSWWLSGVVNTNAFTVILSTRSALFLSQQPTHYEYSDVVQYSVEWRCQEL